ncbi:MAG TPA: hemerythrin domain-containing protein [Elusimicrobiota bacterium]|nr:hemerythrin domain-containing protein [Elusimicrobiota bacterium]
MFGIQLGGGKAMKLLKQDHDDVKDLFDRFEEATGGAAKVKIAREACRMLTVHSRVEEELFYPALRLRLSDGSLLDEADEEHHEAKILIAELGLMNGGEPNFPAKFLVLSENVRHHIAEEEYEIFPAAKRTSIDFDALGERMEQRKKELLRDGVPPGRESDMVRSFSPIVESPSRRAMKTMVPPDRRR